MQQYSLVRRCQVLHFQATHFFNPYDMIVDRDSAYVFSITVTRNTIL